MRIDDLTALCRFIDPTQAPELARRYAAFGEDRAGAALAGVVVAAFPAFGALASARPEVFVELCREGWRARRNRAVLLARMFAAAGDLSNESEVGAGLRRAVQYEKLRIATRELLPRTLHGADVDVTSEEIADLAEAAIEVALAEARRYVAARFGPPLTSSGTPSTFVVIGMGKLGGRELNAGSDVDLLFFYDTDEGMSVPPDGGEPITLHEHWSRVARRLTATLETATAEGMVWRVDLRLRPEGSSGPIANSLPAAERYYESFGRLWERAALLRARPAAGDLQLGFSVLGELSPFVYTRHVDPSVASEMMRLALRARAELSLNPELDLKLGPGGIRDAEFFVQSLQLIWGGREPRVRTTGTLDALRRLRARGLVTDREGRDVSDAYILFRRLEHRVQWATGLQTHAMPPKGKDRDRLARSLGYDAASALEKDLAAARARVSSCFASLLPLGTAPRQDGGRWGEIIGRLDAPDRVGLNEAITRAFGSVATPELVRDLIQLARRPGDLLGGNARERFPDLAPTLLGALVDAADPEQAARFLRTWQARLGDPGVYARPLGEDPRALRRLVAALGASAFIGAAIANRPDLGDSVIFTRTLPTPELARREIEDEVSAMSAEERSDPDAFVGALRRAKGRLTIEVAMADLAGETSTREATLTLSALADVTLEQATRFALGVQGEVRGLAVLSLGKLGGIEIGYGSDLDVLFIFDPKETPPGADPHEYFAGRAQQVIRLASIQHPEGPGYELDTRLRPSGTHGLLVTSLEAFARYHDVELEGVASEASPSVLSSGAAWERQVLVRARFSAGDSELGARAIQVAHVAAYERGAPPSADLHRLRMRMQRELALERPGRHDLKLGRGGLADVEFAVQYLQMVHGRDHGVRTTETSVAIAELARLGYLSARAAESLGEGYRFLRRLEQRIRIVHGSSLCLLEEAAEGLGPLSRRMGLRDRPRASAIEELIARYREVTEAVRQAYLEIVGASDESGETRATPT